MSVEQLRKCLDEALQANRQWEEQYNRLDRDSRASINELKRRVREARTSERQFAQSGHVPDVTSADGDEIKTLHRNVAMSDKSRKFAEEQLEAFKLKMKFLERHCEEETTRREEANREIDRLTQEVRQLKLRIHELTEERNDLLAVGEQANLFKEDFLAEMEAKRRIADENQHLSNKVENLQRELSQLVLTRELGIPVNDELIKQQAARWSSLKASESDSTVSW
jgi:chromosome segregation ATPase